MNFAKFKNKRLLSFTALGLTMLSLITTGMLVNNPETVKADNAQMIDLPKGVNADGAKYAGEYA